MINKFILIFLLSLCSFSFAQDLDPLANYYNKTHRELAGSPTASTRVDTLIFTAYVVLDSIIQHVDDMGFASFAIISTGYSTVDLAQTAARGKLLVVPYDEGTTGVDTLTALNDSTVVWDFRFNRWDMYGKRTWGNKSVMEADSLTAIQRIIDSTRSYGVVKLGRGVYTTSVPVVLDSLISMRLEGTTISRTRDDTSNIFGTIISSTSTTQRDTFGVLQSRFQGQFVSDIVLRGNRLNSNGYYFYRSNSPVVTTLGGSGIDRSLAIFNGANGFSFEGADGNLYIRLESFGNVGSGIKFSNAVGNGKTLAAGSSLEAGTTNVIISGRHGKNGEGLDTYETNANTWIGVQSIKDTTYNFQTYSTRGTLNINPDYEFAIPPRTFSGAHPFAYNVISDNDRAYTWLNGYMGSIHTHANRQGLSDSTDSGTNTTTVIDAQQIQRPNDYYVGYIFTNTTLDSPGVRVTDYVSSTHTFTLASAITGQTSGQTYELTRRPDIGFLADSLASSVFINTTFSENADTVVSATSYANFIFINPIQFDPETDIKDRVYDSSRWFNIDLDNFGGTRTLLMKTNSDWSMRTVGDSADVTITTDSSSVSIASYLGIVDLQSTPTDDASNNGDVHWNRLVPNNIRPQFILWFDADTSSTLRRANVRFNGSASQPNAMTFSGSTDTTRLVVAMPMELSGNNNVARFMDILATTGGAAPTATLLADRVRLYVRSDSLWAFNDGSADVNLMRGGGSGATTLDGLSDVDVTGAVGGNVLMLRADNVTWVDSTVAGSGDITDVVAGNGIVGGATSGSATVSVDTSDTFRWLGIHYHIMDSDSLIFDLSTSLNPIDLHVNGTSVFKVDSSGNTTAVTLLEGANAVPNVTDNITVFAAINSSQLAGEISDEIGTGLLVFGTSPEFTTGHNTVSDGDTLKFNLNVALNPIDLEIGNTSVFTVDSTGIIFSNSLTASRLTQSSSTKTITSVTDLTTYIGGTEVTVGDDGDGTVTLSLPNNAGTDITADLEEEAHVTEHQDGGADEINLEGLDAIADADTLKIRMGVALNALDLEINNSTVWAVDTTGLLTFADGIRQVFNPNATNAGLNVGSLSGDPSAPSNGDLWYDSGSNELTARINGATVVLGAAGGSGDIDGVTAGNGLVGGGTSGTVTLDVDTTDTFRWSGTHTWIRDGDSLIFDLSTSLNPIDLHINGTSVFKVDSTGLITTASVNSTSIVNESIVEADVNWLGLTADSAGWAANRQLEIPAAAFIGTTANGATDAIVSTYLSIKNFDTATAETMTVDIVLPTYWSSVDSIQIDAGTADTAGDSVAYAIQWYGAGDGDAASGTFSTAIHDTLDMGTTANVRKTLRYTQSITGTGLAANARVIWKVYRDPSISDDVAADVYIRGVRIFGKGIK